VKDKETIGVILLNLGGPDSIQAVRPFLYNLFSDRKLIKLGPSFLQKTLAWLLASLRAKKTESMYSLIGGRSPILDITSAQAKALQEALCPMPHAPCPMPHAFKVYIGMRYWHPLIEDVIPVMYRDGIRKSVALSLYPQYSVTTAGSSLTKLKDVVKGYPLETFCLASWFEHPLYIEALADIIKKGLESFSQESGVRSQKPDVRCQKSNDTDNPPAPPLEKGGTGEFEKKGNSNTPDSEPEIHVLFSAHSLPHKIVEKGDPYVRQINGTIREITKIIPIKWHLSFQSKSGPVKWLEPSTDEKLKELAAEGIKNILVVPISFVSDHIETLYEIDILYKNLAEKLGITLKRVDSLNTNPIFIEALKDLVIKSAKEKGWT
jgi:ferrochelatase